MLVLRATQKVLRFLPTPVDSPGESDTALGDWYVNRIHVGRQPILLLVSSESLLPVLTPARDVRSLPDRLPGIVAERLKRLGVDDHLIQTELSAMKPVIVAKTCDRSVLGTMNDFARVLPFYLESHYHDDTSLPAVEARLADTPCRVSGRLDEVILPDRKAVELLWRKGVGGLKFPSGNI